MTTDEKPAGDAAATPDPSPQQGETTSAPEAPPAEAGEAAPAAQPAAEPPAAEPPAAPAAETPAEPSAAAAEPSAAPAEQPSAAPPAQGTPANGEAANGQAASGQAANGEAAGGPAEVTGFEPTVPSPASASGPVPDSVAVSTVDGGDAGTASAAPASAEGSDGQPDDAASTPAGDGPAVTTPAPGVESAPADATAASDGAEAQPAAAQASDGSSGTPPAATSSSGGKKKRRRRRRRRKKKGGDEAAQGEQGAAPAGAESSSGGRKKPRKEPERPAFNVGDEIFGRVSAVTEEAIILDVAGGKASGIYDRAELIQVPPKEGEQFIAKVKSYSTRGGMLRLGRELWDATASREKVREALTSTEPLEGWVTGVIKGGLEVDFDGVRAFAPASHVSVDTGADLTPMLAKKFPFVVTHYAKKGRDVVVSRKQMVEAEHTAQRSEQLEKLQPEQRVKGVVRNVVQWGAFIALPDYGDIEGVVHMSEASHNRGARLNQVFKPGQEVEVEVLRVDEKGKLWLSRKATLDDPWAAAQEKYTVGSIHTGKVVRLTDFGAFVQLEPGIDGLCHVADLSLTHVEHPKEVVKEGQDFEVVIANLDLKNRKVTLHPAPPEDERELPRIGRLSNHQKVQVVVTQIKDAGLGVRILGATGRRARGFIPAGQTGTTRGTDLRKKFPLGTKLDVKVIDADSRRGEARLSIRALKEDAEKQAYREYRKKVQRESGFGTFGDLLKDKLGG